MPVKYAICNRADESPPVDGQEISARAYDPATMDDLRDYEILVEDLPEIDTDELVWDGAERDVREKTEAEKAATTRPLFGMEGLYSEVKARKAQSKPDPITTDELLLMMEKVQRGEVRG